MMGGMGRQSSGGFKDFSNYGFNGAQQGFSSSRKSTAQTNENLDITKTLNVTAKEIFEEKAISVSFTEMEKCHACHGGGYCSNCGGTGIVSTPKNVKV